MIVMSAGLATLLKCLKNFTVMNQVLFGQDSTISLGNAQTYMVLTIC